MCTWPLGQVHIFHTYGKLFWKRRSFFRVGCRGHLVKYQFIHLSSQNKFIDITYKEEKLKYKTRAILCVLEKFRSTDKALQR